MSARPDVADGTAPVDRLLDRLDDALLVPAGPAGPPAPAAAVRTPPVALRDPQPDPQPLTATRRRRLWWGRRRAVPAVPDVPAVPEEGGVEQAAVSVPPASSPESGRSASSTAAGFARLLEQVVFDDVAVDELAGVDDDVFVAPPVLPAAAGVFDAGWTKTGLARLGVSDQALEVMTHLPGAADLGWPDRVALLVAKARNEAEEPHPLGGAAIVGYGPAGAAAALSAMAIGVEVAGVRMEAGSRLLPVTASRLVTLLQRGLNLDA